LQVRGLTVEVGGKVRVDAASFSLHPGDTVAQEIRWDATHTGPMQTPDGRIR